MLVLAAAALILFIRKTDALTYPQFWAEDATVFFIEQYNQGACALLNPYAGYLHLVPRLAALFADAFFPYHAAPYVYNYLSLALTLLVVLSIFSERFDAGNKPLLALSIVLVPHFGGEVFLNITNVQWVLALLLVITLLKDEPGPQYGDVRVQASLDFGAVVFCGLTGPFVVFLLPFFVVRFHKKRTPYNAGITLAALAAASVQIFFMATGQVTEEERTPDNLFVLASVIGRKFFGNLFLGNSLPYDLNPFMLTAAFAFLLFFIAYLAFWSETARRFQVAVFLGFMSAVLLATLVKFRSNPLTLVPPDNGVRYSYLVYVMMAWSLIALMGRKGAWKGYFIKALLAAVLASSLVSGFRSEPFEDHYWAGWSRLIGEEPRVQIPINPDRRIEVIRKSDF